MTSGRHHIPDRVRCLATVIAHQKRKPFGAITGPHGSTWLHFVHRVPYAAMLAAYGWPQDLSDDEILGRLLALNLARAGQRVG